MFDPGYTLFQDVYRIVENWKPKKEYSRETDYRDDLLRFIKNNLGQDGGLLPGPKKKHLIQKESGRHLADIGIDETIGIELKRNLDRKSKADRLIGQIRGYIRHYNYIIVVLCGKSDEEKVNYLEYELDSYAQKSMIESGPTIKVVVKGG